MATNQYRGGHAFIHIRFPPPLRSLSHALVWHTFQGLPPGAIPTGELHLYGYFQNVLTLRQYLSQLRQHRLLSKFMNAFIWVRKTPEYCASCLEAEIASEVIKDRKPLTELDSNSLRGGARRQRVPRSHSGCGLCNVPICDNMRCWNVHIVDI